jgi:hypothetical protein
MSFFQNDLCCQIVSQWPGAKVAWNRRTSVGSRERQEQSKELVLFLVTPARFHRFQLSSTRLATSRSLHSDFNVRTSS